MTAKRKSPRIQVVLTPDALRLLKRLAKERGQSRSEIIRQALEFMPLMASSGFYRVRVGADAGTALVIAHDKDCPVSAPGFVPWCSPEPRPAGYPTCNCDFGDRLRQVLKS